MAFDCAKAPEKNLSKNSSVTVIVPTRDRPELLKAMLDTLESTAPGVNIIIVDNQSIEAETHRLLDSQSVKTNVEVLNFDKPFNYSEICNFAAASAHSEYLVFANNDLVFLEEGWLASLINHLEQPRVGLVGSVLRYPDGTIQHAGIIMHKGGLASHFQAENLFGDGESGCPEVSGVTFALAAIKKSTFDLMSGLDPKFKVGLNDVDLCLRMRSSGYSIVCCRSTKVIHFESQSRKSMSSPSGLSRALCEINLFYKKHGEKAAKESFFVSFPRQRK